MPALIDREGDEKSRLRGKFQHLRCLLHDNKTVPANTLSQIKENVQNKGGRGVEATNLPPLHSQKPTPTLWQVSSISKVCCRRDFRPMYELAVATPPNHHSSNTMLL